MRLGHHAVQLGNGLGAAIGLERGVDDRIGAVDRIQRQGVFGGHKSRSQQQAGGNGCNYEIFHRNSLAAGYRK